MIKQRKEKSAARRVLESWFDSEMVLQLVCTAVSLAVGGWIGITLGNLLFK